MVLLEKCYDFGVAIIVGNRTLPNLLEYRVQSTPEKIFVIFDDLEGFVTRLSYGQFDERVNRTANLLTARGIGRGDKINLHLPNCLEFLFLWFVCGQVGSDDHAHQHSCSGSRNWNT